MADLFRTLIIAAADAETARAIAAAFGPGGVGMWTTPLSATGAEPATHFISSGFIPADFVSLAPCTTWAQDESENWSATDTFPGDAATVFAYAQMAGLPFTLAEIESVFAHADGSAQEPFDAIRRLGLRIVNPAE
jgi:hypothetical protein